MRWTINGVHPAPGTQTPTEGQRVIRVIVFVNFLMFAAFLGLQNVAKEHEMLFRAMLTDTVVLSIQLWVVGSTLLATGLFVRAILKKSTSTTVAGTRKPLVSDGQLLLSWWMTLLAICFYAFMLGRSGF